MNIILATNFAWNDEDLDFFSQHGTHHLAFYRDESTPILEDPASINVIICNWFFKYHDIRDFISLKYIQLTSAGLNAIDHEYIETKGILLYNARAVYSISISEFVIGNILAFYKKYSFFCLNQLQHKWAKNRTLTDLYNKKVLIVGTGSIGHELARRLSVFTEAVYGCNRTIKAAPYFQKIFSLSDLWEILPDFDLVILSLALTEETANLFNAQTFTYLKKTALLVNVARGGLIEEQALLDWLTDNPQAGAVLDVYAAEPLAESNPLWSLNNVILTPHNSFVSDQNPERLRKVMRQNFTDWISQLT